MSLTVHPDPQEPAGGFAFLELPEGTLAEDEVTVGVFDAYGERWLARSEEEGARISIGDARWQSQPFDFGPYRVFRHAGADWVRIGPEIVNKLEEYAPLRIRVGAGDYPATWPDDVPPRAGAAVLGGIRSVSKDRPTQEPRLAGRAAMPPVPEAEPEPAPPTPPVTRAAPVASRAAQAPEAARRWPWLLALLLALAAVGAAAWYLWPQETAEIATVPPAVPVAAEGADPCTGAALRALGDFAAIEEAVRGCGKDVSPDTALALVEEHSAEDDPRALLLLGTLYDGEVEDARIESLIGLTFEPDDARAAEYYARAAEAGSDEAETRLAATCERLVADRATLAKGALDDYCS